MKRNPETIAFWVSRVPHWEVVDGRYFVTISQAGAIPPNGRRALRARAQELRSCPTTNSAEWIRRQRKVFVEMERWLDQGCGRADLHRPEVAQFVMEAIEHRQQIGLWHMYEYVIMPTHLHLFFELGDGRLKETLEQFKRWLSHCATKVLGVETQPFWQREWFDHWSRSDEEDDRIVAYIRKNPVKAGLVNDYTDWPYGSWNSTGQSSRNVGIHVSPAPISRH